MYFADTVLGAWNPINICLNLHLFRNCLQDQLWHVWSATNDLIDTNQNDVGRGPRRLIFRKVITWRKSRSSKFDSRSETDSRFQKLYYLGLERIH
jgi:hypothetical protein